MRKLFKLYIPYGIVIRLSDLSYTWFNRDYKGLGNDSKEMLPFSELPDFVGKLKNESVMEDLRTYALNNRVYGMDMEEQFIDGEKCLRIWFYSDKYFPFTFRGNISIKKMERYNEVLSEVKKIIGKSL